MISIRSKFSCYLLVTVLVNCGPTDGADQTPGSAGAGAGSGGRAGTGGGGGGTAGSAGRAGSEMGDAAPADAVAFDAADARTTLDAFSDAVGDGPSSGRQTARPIGTTSSGLGYYEYLPPGYGDGSKRPILFFFHGVGEDGNGGSELPKVLSHGPPKLINANQWPSSRPFVVLSPQHAPMSGTPDCWAPTEIRDFIAFGTATYEIDPQRIYLTGLSCGALGSGNYFKQLGSGPIAAAVLIAGNANLFWPTQGCALLKQMGLWAFHGDADPTVPITGDNAAMPQFLACAMPRKDVRYTVYPGVGHDSWTRTYDLTAGHDIYTWFLGLTR
jgi:predicted esterase